MKLLLSAIACDPYGFSEMIHGWRACRALARDHKVWVLTDVENRCSLERAREDRLVPASMQFAYVGEAITWHSNGLVARVRIWLRYIRFNREVLATARRLHSEVGFDRVHHITFTTWRVASPLWKLGIPFIWGPISGTEVFPASCLSILSPASQAFELLRMVAGFASRISPGVRECCRRAAWIFAIHLQAYDTLVSLRGTDRGVSLFSGWFFPDNHVARLERAAGNYGLPGPLQLFASGCLEGRKGVAIALEALAIARSRGLQFKYTVSCRGPEYAHLLALSNRLGLADVVSLGEWLSSEDFIEKLQSTHVYLLPSLREGGGLTLMEAMLAGCVPIVADAGGPSDAVTEECGFRVAVTDPFDIARRIADILLELDTDRRRIVQLGQAARRHIAKNYTENTFRRASNKAYATTAPLGK